MIQEELKPMLRRIIQISHEMKLGHIGSCITALPIIEEIYKQKKGLEPFILSSGHAHLAHLVVKEANGEIDFVREQYIETLIERFGIHCDRLAGCDVSTGSLGHGIGIAVGMALADRSKNIYCLLSDGEMAEGSVWESLRIITEQNIDNLKIYVNWNGWGAYQESGMYLYYLLNRLAFVRVIQTNMNDYPEWLQGQIAHYVIMTKEQYEEVMQLLS